MARKILHGHEHRRLSLPSLTTLDTQLPILCTLHFLGFPVHETLLVPHYARVRTQTTLSATSRTLKIQLRGTLATHPCVGSTLDTAGPTPGRV